jgi:hypothetical protein
VITEAAEGEAESLGKLLNQVPDGPPEKALWRSEEETVQSRVVRIGLWSERMAPGYLGLVLRKLLLS